MSDFYYDRQGKPLSTIQEWGRLFGDKSYQQIKQTRVRKFYISTIWLGMDHGFLDGGPPVIFETMVFDHRKKPVLDNWMDRYATEAEAIAGHDRVVEKLKKGEALDV